jgi:hypothetical protein
MRRARAGSAAEAGHLHWALRREPFTPGWALAQPALPAGAEPPARGACCAEARRALAPPGAGGWALHDAISTGAVHHPGQACPQAPYAQLVAGLAGQRAVRTGRQASAGSLARTRVACAPRVWSVVQKRELDGCRPAARHQRMPSCDHGRQGGPLAMQAAVQGSLPGQLGPAATGPSRCTGTTRTSFSG